jgi:putative ABC transport system permease protein
MRTLLDDVRYGLRVIRRSPGFTAAAVVTLGLGIGVNVAVFDVLNVFILTPLSYRAPARVAFVMGWNQKTQRRRFNLPLADVYDVRQQSRTFEDIAAYAYEDADLTGGAERPERVQAYRVTGTTFNLLGVGSLYGRTLQPDDAIPGAPDAAVLSYGLWERRFGRDPTVVGHAMTLNGKTYSVVGVMPRTFEFPVFNFKGEVWIPLKSAPADLVRGSSPTVVAIARLKDGVSYSQAQADVQAIMSRLAADHPQTNQSLGARVVEMSAPNREVVTPALMVISVVVAVVLLLACTNVANLLLARGTSRGPELALRVALGAGRGRIVRQLLTESLLLALMGAGTAIIGAFWALRSLRASLPDIVLTSAPHVLELGVDFRTATFTIGLALLCTLLFGMAPALRAATPAVNETLKQGARGSGGHAFHRVRAALIVGQIAVSLVILVAAGLLVRSFAMLEKVDLGFRADHVATLTISLPDYRYGDADSHRRYFEQALTQVQQVPGVRAAGFVNVLPFSTYNGDTRYSVDGEPPSPPGEEPAADYRVATAGYFEALRIPLRAGRTFDSRDRSASEPVAIVNQSLVHRSLGDRNPIGQRLRLGKGDAGPWRTIIGVVADMRHDTIDEHPAPEVFVPFEQAPLSMMMLAARTTGEPDAAVTPILAALAAVDASQPVFHIKTLSDLVKEAMLTNTWAMSMMSLLGLLALVLATIGIYGVVSYAVNQRGREFGVRLAVGAAPGDLLRLVVGSSVKLIAAGAVIGIAATIGIGRFLSGLLYGVEPSDVTTLAVALTVMVSVALVACLIPARRAMRTDPIAALRAD